MVRDPEWYFFTVFGTPSKTGKWGWRVEGHHLSLNFTLDGGKVVAATPCFFGANPADVQGRPAEGTADPARVEELAAELFALAGRRPEEGRRPGEAVPRDRGGQDATPKVGEPIGLAAAKMNDEAEGDV